jgi:hypothetical protein
VKSTSARFPAKENNRAASSIQLCLQCFCHWLFCLYSTHNLACYKSKVGN